jgi:hypothetical protein
MFLDGVKVYDLVAGTIVFTPDVWTGRQAGEDFPSSRWIGGAVTGSISERRATAWVKDAIKAYLDTGRTPEFTLTGIMDDENSDYYQAKGEEVITVSGVVLSGDINLISIDAAGDVLTDVIGFNAKKIVM